MTIDTSAFLTEPPFDAQYVGTYQPLFGWVGRTGKRRVQGEMAALFGELGAQVAVPPVPGGHRPGLVGTIAPWAHGTVSRPTWGLGLIGNGRSRSGGLAGAALATAGGALSALRRTIRGDASDTSIARPDGPVTVGDRQPSRYQAHTTATLDVASRSSGFVGVVDASAQDGARVIDDLLGLMDELDLTRTDAALLLSPIGLLNLYREYYFDFGTRLGPPVEHLWIAPGSDVEITESYTRTDYSFIEVERSFESTVTLEESATEAETFSQEVERTQQRDLSVGVAAQGGANFQGVYQISASASFDYANSLTESRRQALERTREVSSKVAKQMRRSSRTLTRSSTEVQQSSVRRHRITNPTAEVRNLEMRRKLQHVGVQVQHLGTSLCWQMPVLQPGNALQLAELVHIGASEDFLSTPPPDDAPATLPPRSTELEVPIQFSPVAIPGQDEGIDENHVYVLNNRLFNNRRVATFDDEEDPATSDDVILAEFDFYELPTDGYKLVAVTPGSFRGESAGHKQPTVFSTSAEVTDELTGAFRVVLHTVNFEQQPLVKLTVQLLWAPPPPVAPNPAAMMAHTQELQRKARRALVDGVRDRVKLASHITARHPDDLRAEERSVIYRALVDELVGGTVGAQLQLLSEKIRAIFDVDRMLYYVAPDWWDPQRPGARLDLPVIDGPTGPIALDDRDRTRFRQDGDGRPSYLITEDSAPAPLGRSLGWVAQLDGDDLRNVFLNAPWVKAVLPIRPGREATAIAFLRQAHVEGHHGLEAGFVDDDGRPTGETVEERLLALARDIRRHNDPDAVYAAGQAVYENGFNPVNGRVRLTGEPLEVFAEWVEVVPTRQVVPVPYVPPDRFRPPPEPPPDTSPAAAPNLPAPTPP